MFSLFQELRLPTTTYCCSWVNAKELHSRLEVSTNLRSSVVWTFLLGCGMAVGTSCRRC